MYPHKMRIFDFLSVLHATDSPEKYAIIDAFFSVTFPGLFIKAPYADRHNTTSLNGFNTHLPD